MEALSTYNAQKEDELSFQKGELIELLTPSWEGDDRWFGMKYGGNQTGFFPKERLLTPAEGKVPPLFFFNF